jgi:hypothetical protein
MVESYNTVFHFEVSGCIFEIEGRGLLSMSDDGYLETTDPLGELDASYPAAGLVRKVLSDREYHYQRDPAVDRLVFQGVL